MYEALGVVGEAETAAASSFLDLVMTAWVARCGAGKRDWRCEWVKSDVGSESNEKFGVKVEMETFEGRPSELVKGTIHSRRGYLVFGRGTAALSKGKRKLAKPRFEVPNSQIGAFIRRPA